MNKMFNVFALFIIGFVGIIGCAGDPRGKEDDRAAAAAAGGAGGKEVVTCVEKHLGEACETEELCKPRCDGELICIGGEFVAKDVAEGKCPTASTSSSSGSTSSSSGSSSSGESSTSTSTSSSTSSSGGSGKWRVKSVPDGSVASIIRVNVHAGSVFSWQELTSCNSDKTLCDLPSDPQGKLHVSADVKLSAGGEGTSCTANDKCGYYTRGKYYVIDPNDTEYLLNPTYNEFSVSHCYACNATQRSDKVCSAATANCVP